MADHTKREIERRQMWARVLAGEFDPKPEHVALCACGQVARWHESKWRDSKYYCDACVPKQLIPIARLGDVNDAK